MGSGLLYPSGIEVDGAGHIYFVDNGNRRLLKETASGGAYTQSSIASGVYAGKVLHLMFADAEVFHRNAIHK
jgi:hypothetical protein